MAMAHGVSLEDALNLQIVVVMIIVVVAAAVVVGGGSMTGTAA